MNDDDYAEPERLLLDAQAGCTAAVGRLLESYRGYLTLLARLQVGRRLQGKSEAGDLVQETFLNAYRDFALFRGATEAELTGWLRQILAARVSDLLRRYCGTQRRDVRLERVLTAELDRLSLLLDRGLFNRSRRSKATC